MAEIAEGARELGADATLARRRIRTRGAPLGAFLWLLQLHLTPLALRRSLPAASLGRHSSRECLKKACDGFRPTARQKRKANDIQLLRTLARSGRDLRPAQGLAAIAERLGDMDARDARLAIEVRESPRDTKCPVIAPRAE